LWATETTERDETERQRQEPYCTLLSLRGLFSLAYLGNNYYYLKLFLSVQDLFTEKVKGFLF